MENRRPGGIDSFESTESIDVGDLLTEDVTSSGSFDLRQFGTTSFGKLLQALPVPVLLIDRSYRIFFVNQAWGKISPEYARLPGELVDVISSDAHAIKILRTHLKEIFSTRKPQICEAVLRTERTGV